ncbi:MAG: entericidin A/B family lipoprotein [Alphaproteobacteria bacterium]|nr:entericidin A/B family lipoprotein [Alphaproteobacteria bacterium]
MRFVLIILSLFTVAACNTISGIGQDIEAGGGAIAGTAENTKRKM